MKIPTKKLKNGFEMPVFGIGTWGMGGRYEKDTAMDAKDVEAIKSALKMGVTHVDTAEMYAEGHAEELIGEAIRDFDRGKLFLASKVSPAHFRHDDVVAACRASLKRLGTNYLDLYLLHHPNRDVSLEETMKAMDELMDAGLIKNIGVSNFKKERLRRARAVTKYEVVVNQVYYNLKNREPEFSGLLEYCQNEDVILEAYRPIEKGMLAEGNVPIVDKMAKEYSRTPAQIAIAWLISQKNVVAIAKSSSVEHLQENLGSIGFMIERNDLEHLREKFPNIDRASDYMPLI